MLNSSSFLTENLPSCQITDQVQYSKDYSLVNYVTATLETPEGHTKYLQHPQ